MPKSTDQPDQLNQVIKEPQLTDIDTAQQEIDVLPKSLIITGQRGAGKALDVNTPVLTRNGFVPASTIRAGDYLTGSDGKPTKVEGVYPQGKRLAYRVTFSDKTTAAVDGDHLWQVQEKNDTQTNPTRWRVMSTKEILDAGIATGERQDKKWRIPLTAPINFYSEKQLPIHPYVLGVLLGDGCLRGSPPTVSTHKWIRQKIAGLASISDRAGGVGCVAFSVLGVTSTLREMGLAGKLSHEKSVPQEYLLASPVDRLALLQGLMDTDGTPQHNGGTEFSTTSDRLKDNVIFLCQSLGGVARANLRPEPKYTHNGEQRTGKPCWRVNIKLPTDLYPFSLPYKVDQYVSPTKYPPARLIHSIEPVGSCDMVCFKVAAENGLFLINDCIVTHNTTLAATVQEGIAKHVASGMTKAIVLDNVLWLLTDEQGITSLVVRGIKPRYLIDFRSLLAKTENNVREALRWIHEYLAQARQSGINWCVVDTVTSLGGYLEGWYVYGPGCPTSSRTGNRDSQTGWGLLGTKYFELYETLTALDYRTAWLAHPKINAIEDVALDVKAKPTEKAKAVVTGTPGDNYIIPAISGQKFANLLTGQCNISGWLQSERINDKRHTSWMPFGGHGSQGKNRYENILDRSEPPDLYSMNQKIVQATRTK